MTVSQYFVYKRPIAWTMLVFTAVWGAYAYLAMPRRQDPLIQVRNAVVQTAYPGATPLEVEQEVSRKIEKRLAENPAVEHVHSLSRQGLSVVYVDLYDTIMDAESVWQDLDNKLSSISDLPSISGQPVRPGLNKDFGDTVAVMLTLSSPPVSYFEVKQRATRIAAKLDEFRSSRAQESRDRRYSGVLVHPSSVDPGLVERLGKQLLTRLTERGFAEDGAFLTLPGAGAVDFKLPEGRDEESLRREMLQWRTENLGAGLGHPDLWPSVLVRDTSELEGTLKRLGLEEPGGVARYSYEELRKFADLIQDRLRQSTRVGKIEQIGALDEAIHLYYSDHRLGALGLDLNTIGRKLAERNINQPGGTVELAAQSLPVKTSGKIARQGEIGDVVIEVRDGTPVYLRDLVEIVRGYEDPARVLNFRSFKEDTNSETGKDSPRLWTTRAITLSVKQVRGSQISEFDSDVKQALESLKGVLPDDLRVERSSNEPEQVAKKLDEFSDSFVEAVIIVVLVCLLFMEWRSALLVALSIPITVALTLGFCHMLGVDLQQISIAALIIALGLLVDDPVVAGDAINRELAHGTPRDVAAWLGPQKLSRAILYATITNCVAFLPLLLVSGVVGEFIWSLPVVVTSSLVASRLVSMTFIPLLGYYMLKGQKGMESGLGDGSGGSRFARIYNGFSEVCMDHKWASLTISLVALGAGLSLIPWIGTNFFPKDLQAAFTVNLYLPEGTPIRETKAETMKTLATIDQLIGDEVEAYTTFVGAGGPRFWLSIIPEQSTSGYAQVIVHTRNPRKTDAIAKRLQRELPPQLTAARVHVQQLDTGPPIGIPVQIRVMGPELATVRRLGEEVKVLLREDPGTDNIQDDWDPESLQLALKVDSDRANMAGVSNQDVASLMNTALSGLSPTYVRERDRLIPVTFRLRPDERNRVGDLRTLSLISPATGGRVPLEQVATLKPEFISPRIARRDHERCITVKSDTVPGVLASRVVDTLDAKLVEASKKWPPGYRYSFGGEKDEQGKGFASMSRAMIVSILAIYLALVLQFNSLAKPLVVFAAVPFGMVGGLMGLLMFDVPLGFFALLGLSSLAGVIISHVIVLFEYIEEAHERGEPLRRAVIDAALVRLRPVLVTVLATVGGLIPLAIKGGPLWEPLCYVQIIGLLSATLVTKVVVPVLYVIFVEDLKLISWAAPGEIHHEGPPRHGAADSKGHPVPAVMES